MRFATGSDEAFAKAGFSVITPDETVDNNVDVPAGLQGLRLTDSLRHKGPALTIVDPTATVADLEHVARITGATTRNQHGITLVVAAIDVEDVKLSPRAYSPEELAEVLDFAYYATRPDPDAIAA